MSMIRFTSCRKLVPSVIITSLMLCNASMGALSEYHGRSPDGKLNVTLACKDSRLTYSLSWNGRKLLNASKLSLLPNASYKILSSKTSSIDKKWKTV